MAESGEVMAALRRLAEAYGESPTDEMLEEIEPLAARVMRVRSRVRETQDLGETEPAFGLRFDGGA